MKNSKQILELFPTITNNEAAKFFNNDNELLTNVINYIYDQGCNAILYEHAPSDNFTNNEVFITSYDYTSALENFLSTHSIDLGFEDEYISSENYAYYTQNYNNGYNFIIRDGYIIGEDDPMSYDDILETLLSGTKEDVYFLPRNGLMFNELLKSGKFHHIDLSNDYYPSEINNFIDKMNKKNYIVISMSCTNEFLVLNSKLLYEMTGINL